MKWLVLCWTLVLSLSSCWPVGDGYIQAKYRVTDEAGVPFERCIVSIILVNEAVSLDSKTSSGEAVVSFVIPPLDELYAFDFDCDGAKGVVRSEAVQYASKGKSQIHDLGQLRVQRER